MRARLCVVGHVLPTSHHNDQGREQLPDARTQCILDAVTFVDELTRPAQLRSVHAYRLPPPYKSHSLSCTSSSSPSSPLHHPQLQALSVIENKHPAPTSSSSNVLFQSSQQHLFSDHHPIIHNISRLASSRDDDLHSSDPCPGSSTLRSGCSHAPGRQHDPTLRGDLQLHSHRCSQRLSHPSVSHQRQSRPSLDWPTNPRKR